MAGVVAPFTKIYDHGLDTLSRISDNAMALKFYVFLVKHCDKHNSILCSLETAASSLDVCKMTIKRSAKYLVDHGVIEIAKIGTANCYILDKDDVWKNKEESKHYCAFGTKVLVGTKENPDFVSKIGKRKTRKAA